MRRDHVWFLLIGGAILVAAGCASGEEWKTWKEHPTHFASGEHFFFSARNNRDGTNPSVKRQDIAMARDEGWWGNPVAVSQEQMLER